MMINNIISYLDYLYPNAVCELEYSKDYELLLAIVMSAQTTDKRVNSVNKILFKKYDSLDKISKADIKDIESIIRPIGTYKKKAMFIKEIATKLVNDNIKNIPNDKEYLSSLPGVGRKTINVFLSIIYNEPLVGVDTHVNRVSKRLGLVDEDDNVLEVENKLSSLFPKEKLSKIHHQLVFFGRYKCKSINPICNDCKLKDICKYYNRSK